MPVPAGATAVICVGLSTLKSLAAVPPNSTSVAPVKSVPVIVTLVPPASARMWGQAGDGRGGDVGVRSALPVPLVPLGVATVTSTAPLPAGAIAVIWVGPSTVKSVAGVPPNSTSVAPEKLVPVMVTLVPPPTGPTGAEPVTVGGDVGEEVGVAVRRRWAS